MWWTRSGATPPATPEPGRVTDHRTTPPGVMPRHLQQWLTIGVAVVMVGIMALSRTPARTRPASDAPATAAVVDPNQQRIEEYQRRIQEQAQRLAAEQAQLQLTKAAVTQSATAGGGAPTAAAADAEPRSAAPPRPPREESVPHVADNVAFSADRHITPIQAAAPEPPAPTVPPFVLPVGTPLMPMASPPTAPSSPSLAPTNSNDASTTAVTPIPGRLDATPASTGAAGSRYRLLEGTVIDTVLTNRLDGTFAGPVNCLVSVPVYAADEQHLVIPAGARVLGESKAVNTFGQTRLAVVFHRILLPNGTHIDLNGFHGLNQVGDLGLQDQVDRHYAQIFGVSLAIGVIAGFAQAQTSVGLDASGLDIYRQGVATSVSQSAARILDRFLNLLPTVTIREGHRIKVYLANDLDLPAYRLATPMTGGRP